MPNNSIDTLLHRSIKGKSSDCSLLPKSSCEATVLGNGDTYHSMDLIKDFIDQDTNQTKELSKTLRGSSLKETIDNVYGFLYSNLQYQTDGATQYLRSPACSCASRKEGLDCKSYSIFAGCILSNLGISYRIRKIRQSHDSPGKFSHVYIVVPKDQQTGDLSQGYYVIDGTKHANNEANFIDKYDIIMKHIGLKGAYSGNGQTTTLPPISIDKCKRAFTDFLQFLQHKGVSTQVLSDANAHGQKCFNKNQNPPFQIIPQGFIIEDKHYPFRPQPRVGGLAGDPEGEFDIQEIFSFAEGITNGGLFGNTIGAVLGNGWRIGCWGTSNNPVKSEGEVKQDSIYFIVESGVSRQVNTQTVNKFSEQLSIYLAARDYGRTNPDIAKCTRDGNEAGFAAMAVFKSEMFNKIEQAVQNAGGRVIIDGYKTVSNFNLDLPSGYHDGRIFPLNNYTQVEVPQFKVTKNAVLPNQGGGGTTTGTTTGTNTTIGSTGGVNDPNFVHDPQVLISKGAKFIHQFYASGRTSAKNRAMITLMQNYYTANPLLKVSSMAFLPPFIPFNQRPIARPLGGDKKLGSGGLVFISLLAGTAYLWNKKNKKTKTT